MSCCTLSNLYYVLLLFYFNFHPCGLSIFVSIPGRRSKCLGCFEDPGTPRVLPVIVEASPYSNPQMSPETCVERCAAWNFRYAAMQQYHFCFCGNMHNRYGNFQTTTQKGNCEKNNFLNNTCVILTTFLPSTIFGYHMRNIIKMQIKLRK